MEKAGTTAALVGFLTEATVLDTGAEIAIGAWTKPGAEPEVAVHIGRDVAGGATAEEAAAAIAGLGAAIEVVDIDAPMDDPRPSAATSSTRHVILGDTRACAARFGTDDVATRDDAFNGHRGPGGNVRHVGDQLDAFGRLSARRRDHHGSIVPLIAVAPGDRIDYRNDRSAT